MFGSDPNVVFVSDPVTIGEGKIFMNVWVVVLSSHEQNLWGDDWNFENSFSHFFDVNFW